MGCVLTLHEPRRRAPVPAASAQPRAPAVLGGVDASRGAPESAHPPGRLDERRLLGTGAGRRGERGRHRGWLEFGEPPHGLYHLTQHQPHRLVRPEPGMLAMFPSFLYHRTVPYQFNEERLSVAFDILPRVVDPA